MVSTRVLAVWMAGALGVAGFLVAPALDATMTRYNPKTAHRAPVHLVSGAFTPAAADPRLAAVFAHGGLAAGDFHFTPAESQRGARAVTVAVRVLGNRPTDNPRLAATSAPVGIAPIAMHLGVGVGWKRFAVSGDLSKVDLGQQPGSREAADVALSYSLKRFTGRIKAAADRPLGAVATLVDQPPSYSVDVGGSYSLSRRLDLTAGVRYRSDRERLGQIDDDRRDSQAAYVGTVFRF